jgi:hypothetical protein
LAEIGPAEGGDAAATTPRKSYWDKLAKPAAPAREEAASAAAGPAPRTEDRTFVVEQASRKAGYVGLLVAVLMLVAIVNRAGSRWYFVAAAVLVLLGVAQLYWWRSQFAPTRVDLIDGRGTLSVIAPRQTTQIPVASLTKVDQDASPVAQFFGWPELTLHHPGGRFRIGRPQDPREFFWQLGRSNPTLAQGSPRTEQRPWIVTAAVGLILLGVLSSMAFTVRTAGHSSTRTLGLTVLLIGVVRVLLCIRLWAGNRRAWRTFTALAVVGVVIGLASRRVSMGSLCSEVVIFAVLTSPGVRRWATD